MEVVIKETKGAFLFGYLVGVAAERKSVGGFWKVCGVHSTAVSSSALLQRERKQEIAIGSWGRLATYLRVAEVRRGKEERT